MNFKKILRRINRGILLAVITLIVLIIYIIVDTSLFKKNIPELEKIAQEYYEQIGEIAVRPESEWDKENLKLTDEGVQNLVGDYKQLFDEYWTSTEQPVNAFYYVITKKEIFSTLEDDITYSSGYLKSYNFNISSIDVAKTGPNSVDISYEYEIAAEYYGKNVALLTAGRVFTIGEDYESYPESEFGKELEKEYTEDYEKKSQKTTSLMKYFQSGNEVLKIKKIDGKWKINGVVQQGYSSKITDVGGDE